MNIFRSNTYQHAGHSRRPSLYEACTKSKTDDKAFSILDKLEPNRKRQKTAWCIAWTTPLLSLIAIMLVVGLNGGFRDVAISPLEVGALTGKVNQTQLAASVQAADTMFAAPTENAGVAQIAAELFQVQTPEPTDELITLINEANRSMVVAQAVDESPSDVLMAANAVANRENFGETRSADVAKLSPTRTSQPKPAAKAHANRAKVAKDKDVELIGALLAHVATPRDASVKTPSRKSQAVSPAAQTVATSVAMRRARNTPSAQGGVRHAVDDSIDAQVARCRELGFFEGEICRLRTCSNLWGKNPACPPSAPTAPDS